MSVRTVFYDVDGAEVGWIVHELGDLVRILRDDQGNAATHSRSFPLNVTLPPQAEVQST